MPSLPSFATDDPASKLLNAATLNEIMRRLKEADRLNARTRSTPFVDKATVECYAINNTSGAFDEFSIVTPIGVGIAPTTLGQRINFQQRPTLDIDEPILATDFPCITLEPIKANGGVGRVAIGGIALCQVNFSSSSHLYANPTPSVSSQLTSSSTQGYMRVLWKESGTGVKWAAVTWEQPSSTGQTFEQALMYKPAGAPWANCFDTAIPANATMTGTATVTVEFTGSVPAFSSHDVTVDVVSGTPFQVGKYTLFSSPFLVNYQPDIAMTIPVWFSAINGTGSPLTLRVGIRPSGPGPVTITAYTAEAKQAILAYTLS